MEQHLSEARSASRGRTHRDVYRASGMKPPDELEGALEVAAWLLMPPAAQRACAALLGAEEPSSVNLGPARELTVGEVLVLDKCCRGDEALLRSVVQRAHSHELTSGGASGGGGAGQDGALSAELDRCLSGLRRACGQPGMQTLVLRHAAAGGGSSSACPPPRSRQGKGDALECYLSTPLHLDGVLSTRSKASKHDHPGEDDTDTRSPRTLPRQTKWEKKSQPAERRIERSKAPTNTGRWTALEHARFLEGIRLYGKAWKSVAKVVQSRTLLQIRTHAQKHFQKVDFCSNLGPGCLDSGDTSDGAGMSGDEEEGAKLSSSAKGGNAKAWRLSGGGGSPSPAGEKGGRGGGAKAKAVPKAALGDRVVSALYELGEFRHGSASPAILAFLRANSDDASQGPGCDETSLLGLAGRDGPAAGPKAVRAALAKAVTDGRIVEAPQRGGRRQVAYKLSPAMLEAQKRRAARDAKKDSSTSRTREEAFSASGLLDTSHNPSSLSLLALAAAVFEGGAPTAAGASLESPPARGAFTGNSFPGELPVMDKHLELPSFASSSAPHGETRGFAHGFQNGDHSGEVGALGESPRNYRLTPMQSSSESSVEDMSGDEAAAAASDARCEGFHGILTVAGLLTS